MEIYGSGMLNLGYMGGVYDAGTGLICMGNGQYYDPSTGRFLTRGAQQDQSNPYTPWNSDPAGMLIAPLALLGLVFGRKKTRTNFDQFVILFVIVLSVGLSMSACQMPTIDEVAEYVNNVTFPKDGIEIDIGDDTVIKISATTSNTATNTPTYTCTPSPTATTTNTMTPSPTSTIDELLQYNVRLTENDEFWTIENQMKVLQAIKDVAEKFGNITGETPIDAFTRIYQNLDFEWCNNCVNGYGWCYDDNTIRMDGMYVTDYLATRNIIHELGHMFDRKICASRTGNNKCVDVFSNSARSDLGDVWNTKYCEKGGFLCLTRNGFEGPDTGVYWGFAGGWANWQYGATDGPGEVWADMFLAWVYGAWDDDIYGFGKAKKQYMDEVMKTYLNSIN